MPAKKPQKVEILQRFKELNQIKFDLEAKLEANRQEIIDLKSQIMGKFEREGLSSSRLETGELVYTHVQYWAKPIETKNKEDVMTALRLVGLGHLITEGYNSNSLSAIIREMKKNKEDIPEELANVIEVEPTFDIRIKGLK